MDRIGESDTGIRTMTSSLFKAFPIDLERENLNVALDRRKKKLAEAAVEYTLHALGIFGLQACLCYTVSCWYPREIDRHASLSFACGPDHSILSLPPRGARARYGSYKPRSNVASICLRNILQYLLLEKETFPPHCFRFAFVHTPPSGRSNARWFMQIHTPDQYQISLFR